MPPWDGSLAYWLRQVKSACFIAAQSDLGKSLRRGQCLAFQSRRALSY